MNLETNIKDIINEIRLLAPDFRMNVEKSSIYGNDIEYKNDNAVYIGIQFEDCVMKASSNEKNSILKCNIEPCIKSYIYMEKIDDLYKILFKYKVGFIEVNCYEKGTQIAFYIRENGYEKENNIEVSTPGIGSSILNVGDEYYVCFTKYGVNKNIFDKKKIIDIKFSRGYGYEVQFENLENIDIYTRGHIKESQKLVNRIDHIIISKDKKVFIGSIIKKIGEEYGFYDKEYTSTLKLILKETIEEM